MKDKLLIVLGVLLFCICCGVGFYYMEGYEAVYYTKVDNAKVEKLSTRDSMKYEYQLDCYDKNGKRKALKFKTNRELREGAFLSLEVRIFGVHQWQEVQWEELSRKVQEKLS